MRARKRERERIKRERERERERRVDRESRGDRETEKERRGEIERDTAREASRRGNGGPILDRSPWASFGLPSATRNPSLMLTRLSRPSLCGPTPWPWPGPGTLGKTLRFSLCLCPLCQCLLSSVECCLDSVMVRRPLLVLRHLASLGLDSLPSLILRRLA